MARRKRTELIVVHVTGTPPRWDGGVAGVRRMHLKRGFSDIGYGGGLRLNGAREIGRGLDQIGAHVRGWNSTTLGLFITGGVDANGKPQNNATEVQLSAMIDWLGELVSGPFPNAKICGHRDLSPDLDGDGIIEPHEHMKACPCFDVIPWANNNGLPGADIRGNWDEGTLVNIKGPDDRSAWLQKLLAQTGVQFGPVDGIIGKRTIAAINEFQSYSGLPETGVFDPETVAVLRARFDQTYGRAA